MVEEHPLTRCHYRNTVSYFLRLPDGAVEGTGFLATQMQSLKKLEGGEIAFIEAVDRSTTYQSWGDLSRTLTDLLMREKQAAGTANVHLHTHDPDVESNPGDHADHRAVGRLGSGVAARLGLPVSFYVGYAISQRPPNLSIRQATAKMLAFMTYDRQRLDVNRRWSAYAEEPTNYSSWLFRTYRQMGREDRQ